MRLTCDAAPSNVRQRCSSEFSCAIPEGVTSQRASGRSWGGDLVYPFSPSRSLATSISLQKHFREMSATIQEYNSDDELSVHFLSSYPALIISTDSTRPPYLPPLIAFSSSPLSLQRRRHRPPSAFSTSRSFSLNCFDSCSSSRFPAAVGAVGQPHDGPGPSSSHPSHLARLYLDLTQTS